MNGGGHPASLGGGASQARRPAPGRSIGLSEHRGLPQPALLSTGFAVAVAERSAGLAFCFLRFHASIDG